MQTHSSKHAYRISSAVEKQSRENVSSACMCWGGGGGVGTEFLGPPEPTAYM